MPFGFGAVNSPAGEFCHDVGVRLARRTRQRGTDLSRIAIFGSVTNFLIRKVVVARRFVDN